MKRELQPHPNTSIMASTSNNGKSAAMWGQSPLDDGMDELLQVLGYKVKSSSMADVAQKIEQLEEFMGSAEEDGLSHLASDTVHYNPSDLSTWLESMISEITPNPSSGLLDDALLTHHKAAPTQSRIEDIPGEDVFTRQPKRLKPSMPIAESSRPLMVVDSQENGVRLVHGLMACAEAVQQNNLNLAKHLVTQISYLSVSQPGPMRKVATFFAEALAQRIFRVYPSAPLDHSYSEILQSHFYETCPNLKFAHFTANQAILEAFQGKKRVHVIDFSMNQGMQWPALMQALALRPGGPPTFRLTGIGPPAMDNSDHLQEVGWKLAQLAETIHVEFEYRGFVANSLADLDASMLELRPTEPESVAVNSVFEFHKLLARPGAMEKVFNVVKTMRPEIITVVEQESNHNGPVFLNRFNESLHYYSTLFDSLEGSVNDEDKRMSEVYLGKQIFNVVACEGIERVERHETLAQWRTRFDSAGFVSVHLGSNAFKQASMLLALFAGGDGYKVEENDGCLMLGWHTRPLIATSAWRLGRGEVVTQ